jgi:hypothetical protein
VIGVAGSVRDAAAFRWPGGLRSSGTDLHPAERLVLDEALTGVVGFLALLGVVALALRLFRSLARMVLVAAEIASASAMTEASVRRGDLTGMAEAREAERRARVGRRWNFAATLFWVAWLTLPLAAGVAATFYALAAPLWLVPSGSFRKDRR